MASRHASIFLIACFGAAALYTGLRGDTVPLLAALLVLVAAAAAYAWNHFVFAKLTLERKLNRRCADFDAPIVLRLSAANRKVLPIFGLKVNFTITSGLEVEPAAAAAVHDAGYDMFQEVLHLSWYEKRSRVYQLRPARRGRFQFGTGSLHYTDPFGFFSNAREEVFDEDQLIVFPRIVPIRGLDPLHTYLFGSRPKEGWIFQDPLNRVGTRPYQSTDSARKINWKATARHIQAQVDLEKPSFDREVILILDQPPGLPWWTSRVANNLEIAIMAAASLIHSYAEQGYELKLVTNLVSKTHGTGGLPGSAARGRAQRNQHLTNLALLQSFSMEPTAKVLARLQYKIRPGSSILIITTAVGRLSPAFLQQVRRLGLQGKVAVIRVLPDSSDAPREAGLREWRIEGGEPWHEAAALELS